MAKLIVFIHTHDRPGILEAELSEAATIGELNGVFAALGIKIDAETFVFVDESEHHQSNEHHHPVGGLRHGSRIHVCRCKRIKTSVHFLDKTETREFAPGNRVKAVKEWAVLTFKLNPKDAAEHVLQICGSPTRPSTDTRLNELVKPHECVLCFDLVPEKRVEG